MSIAELCAMLIRIPTSASESTLPAIRACADVLAPAGFTLLHQVETSPGAVHALLERPGIDPPLLFDAHLDTVPAGDASAWAHAPLNGDIDDENVWGRGACDNKGPLAALLTALLQYKGKRRVLVSLTGDEEGDMRGIRALCEHSAVQMVKQAVVLEPTRNLPVYGHKGNSRIRVDIMGRAAHSSRPWNGRNAIEDKSRLMLATSKWFASNEGRRRQEAFGDEPSTLAVTMDNTPNGAFNVIPDRSSYWYNYRPLPGDADPYTALMKEISGHAWYAGIQAQMEVEFSQPPLMTPRDASLVQAFEQASEQTAGWVSFGTHGGFLASDKRQIVVFGPGDIAFAHRQNERIAIEELERGAQILLTVLAKLGK